MASQDMTAEKNALLMDSEVQKLIQYMVEKGEYAISPQITAKGMSYPMLTTVFLGKSETEVSDLLSKLTDSGLLKSRLFDKVIVCPTCGSPHVYSKYNCPRCDSFDIGKAPIIEHTRCGYIGSKEKFLKDDLLICPKCRNSVGQAEYKKIGMSFQCNSCGSRFETPRMSHKCSSCDDVFTYKEAKYEPLRVFELTEEAKRNVAKGTLPLESVLTTLKSNGFDVGLRRNLIGKSGATHNFDLVARRGDSLVVANIAFEPKEEDIIALFAKKYDVNPTFTILIALSPPSSEQESVSKAYDVKIMSPAGTRSIGEQIVDLVATHTNKPKEESDEIETGGRGNQLEDRNNRSAAKPRKVEYSFDQEWEQYNF